MDNHNVSDQMLAAVYYGPRDVRLEQRDVPRIGADECLLRVVSTGICGTDIRIFKGEHAKYPPGTNRVPGHEMVGDIVSVGEEVKGVTVGQRVFVAPNMGCGQCNQCISGNNNLCANYDAPGITYDGSFAEYMRIPSQAIVQGNLIEIDKDLDPAIAALIEPFACVMRGQDVLDIQPGENVLIVGAGPIGVMHVMMARLRGAAHIIVSELNPDRLDQVKGFGADTIVNSAEDDLYSLVFDKTKGVGADVVIVAAPSHEAQKMALEVATIGGRINFFGGLSKKRPTVNLDSNLIHYRELHVTGTAACSTNDCHRAALIAGSGRIDFSEFVGARFALRDANEAFRMAEEGKYIKVVLEP